MKLFDYYQMKVNGKFQALKSFCNICNTDDDARDHGILCEQYPSALAYLKKYCR
jgi:hypothetical protein